MGATVDTRPDELPPLRIRGGKLRGLRYVLPVASAQVKSCVLLAGLFADEPTAVREDIPTRDHTEIALQRLEVRSTVTAPGSKSRRIRNCSGYLSMCPGIFQVLRFFWRPRP